jgi:aminopeptidase N
VAARLVDPLGTWRRHDGGRAALMRGQLERIAAQPQLSRLTHEKVSKAL